MCNQLSVAVVVTDGSQGEDSNGLFGIGPLHVHFQPVLAGEAHGTLALKVALQLLKVVPMKLA